MQTQLRTFTKPHMKELHFWIVGFLIMSNIKHGMCYHPSYNRWLSVKQRCYYKKSINYKYYGGKGITMYDEWIHDPASFINYIMDLPNAGGEGLTLDRIDSNKNYEPGNLRWTDWHTQAINREMKPGKSGYFGVSFNNNNNKWFSYIWINKKNIYLGCCHSKAEAVLIRNEYIIEHSLENEYKLQ